MTRPLYLSTRGAAPPVDFAGALLNGIAPDGGLYLPERWPMLDAAMRAAMGEGDYVGLTRAVLAAFVGDALPKAEVARAARRLAEVFDHPEVAPLVRLDDELWVLELFHGPTAAFKDVAMQVMAVLLDAALAATNERLLLLTATSGDTGAAAVRAFAGAERIDLVVLHPLDRVSPVQRRQMTTTDAPNVVNLAVEGDFDACQALVKTLLADPGLSEGRRVSSVNSINWGRLAGQIPYYLAAFGRLAGEGGGRPRFVVPTGNFGDACAGWAARAMGADLDLLAAVNANDALARALDTGVYARTPAVETASVSMDVQAPSNFERLVFEASGRDAALTRDLFAAFARDGRMVLPPDLLAALRAEVAAVSVRETEGEAAARVAWRRHGRVICPHTAVALSAALATPSRGPTVVLSTAHAAKFPDFSRRAIGRHPEPPPSFALIADRSERFAVVKADLEAVRARLPSSPARRSAA